MFVSLQNPIRFYTLSHKHSINVNPLIIKSDIMLLACMLFNLLLSKENETRTYLFDKTFGIVC